MSKIGEFGVLRISLVIINKNTNIKPYLNYNYNEIE